MFLITWGLPAAPDTEIQTMMPVIPTQTIHFRPFTKHCSWTNQVLRPAHNKITYKIKIWKFSSLEIKSEHYKENKNMETIKLNMDIRTTKEENTIGTAK